jgi:hypothetical protein
MSSVSVSIAQLAVLPDLASLDLKGCTGMNFVAVLLQYVTLDSLTTLNMWGCTGVDAHFLSFLASALIKKARKISPPIDCDLQNKTPYRKSDFAIRGVVD